MKFLFYKIISRLGKIRVAHTGKQRFSNPDRWLLAGILVLSFFGILMVYDSSVAIALRDFSNQYYFAFEQLKWLLIGLVALLIVSKIPYSWWYAVALPLLGITLCLLLAVFIPGVGIRAMGAHRWVKFGFFVLQPAEFTKLAIVVYLSAWFSHPEKKRFLSFLLLVGTAVGLVLLEPDLGTSIIILSIAVLLYFFSGAPLRHFFILFPLAGTAIILLTLVAPYRMQRLTTFFNLQQDPLGSSYQIRQVLIGLGSGGWTGVGIGKSRQKYEYLPEANTDSIFAIIGEEIGFVGAFSVILLFLFIIWRGFRVAARAPDPFAQLLALGLSSWVAVQTLINLGAMVRLLPLTGVPLPFISYGGSSLILLLVAMGIVLNISTYRK
jgi:cell division protein FtsW